VPATPIIFCSHVVELGGAEMVLLDLLETLDRRQFTPHLAVPGDGPLSARAAELGTEVHAVPLAGNSKLGKARAILRSRKALQTLAERLDCQLLVANSMIAGYAAVLAQRPGLACVWHLHTVMRSQIARAALRRAAAVIAPSRAGLDAAGLPNGHHISNGVPDRFFAARDPAAGKSLRTEHDIPAGASVLGIVGRLDPHKGHDVLLASLATSWPTPAPHLVIAGGELFSEAHGRLGDYGARLRREVTRLGLEGRVHWLGELDDTASLLPQLDALVVPSIRAESAPRTIAEAQAASCPVLASAVGGIPELLRGGDAGVLVAAGSAAAITTGLQQLLCDEPSRTQQLQNGLRHANAHYRMTTFARRCEAVFAQANAAAMTAMT
jgi:glycosyltransferase involved in cell wall biosynthesis